MTAPILQTPIAKQQAQSIGPRMFRKQVLPFGSFNCKDELGRPVTLNIDEKYVASLADSFQRRAYDSVKLFLADGNNKHNVDPERARGTVKGLEVTDTGLDAIVELSDAGASLISDHPDIGVSARIVPNVLKSDGRAFPLAIQHVLATVDPVVTGMRPWEAVNLSTEDNALTVVDLSAESFTQEGPAVMADLDEKQQERLNKLLALPDVQFDALVAAPSTPTDPAAEPDDLSDEQLALLVADAEAAANEPETAGAALSTEAQAAIDLANASADEANQRTIDLATTLAASQWQNERQSLLTAGVPAAVLVAVDPILSLPAGAIELSNSDGPDPVAALRAVIDACKGIVDLSVIGEATEPADDRKAREEKARAYAKTHGIR